MRGAAGATFGRESIAGVIDQDATHELGGGSEELRAVLPPHARLSDQPDVRFVDERGGLQCVIGTLAAQRRFREAVQLAVDDRHQRIERSGLAVVPGLEQTGDVRGRVVGHEVASSSGATWWIIACGRTRSTRI
jgi:hypothetical protein